MFIEGLQLQPFFVALLLNGITFNRKRRGKMDYMEFINAVCDYINETADDVTTNIHTTVKNNSVRLSGLSFKREGYNASPTIYMENYYSDYLAGEDISDIGDRLLRLYRENDMAVSLDMSFFETFESVKDRLFIKLINKKANLELLADIPYEEYLDLAIVVYVRVCDRKIGNGIIMVRNEHLSLWGTDAETVLYTAKKNTHDHDDFTISHIIDVLNNMGSLNRKISDRERAEFPMYVATNRKMINGASVLTMTDKLKEFGKVIGGDYYVIPSSVHELILLGQNSTDRGCDIDGMIKEVNRTQVGPDDVLSDHVYMYSLEDEVLLF